LRIKESLRHRERISRRFGIAAKHVAKRGGPGYAADVEGVHRTGIDLDGGRTGLVGSRRNRLDAAVGRSHGAVQATGIRLRDLRGRQLRHVPPERGLLLCLPELGPVQRVPDVYGALKILATHPKLQADRIAL
jgi:hypothetical protein